MPGHGDIAMEGPLLTLAELYPRTLKYQPRRDEDWRVVETGLPYAERMRSGPLASWPQEVLVEWLHRHANNVVGFWASIPLSVAVYTVGALFVLRSRERHHRAPGS